MYEINSNFMSNLKNDANQNLFGFGMSTSKKMSQIRNVEYSIHIIWYGAIPIV